MTCTELHKNKNMVNHHGGVLLTGGYVYGYDDNKGLHLSGFPDDRRGVGAEGLREPVGQGT